MNSFSYQKLMPDQSESALRSAGLSPLLGVGAWDSTLLCDSFPVQAQHRNRPFVVGGVGGGDAIQETRCNHQRTEGVGVRRLPLDHSK